MPVRSDPDTATSRWVSGMQNSTQAMTRGVQAVTVSPGLKASQAADKWVNNTVNSRDKFVRRTAAVQLGDWQNSMTKYGISRVAQGAQQKQSKFQSFMSDYLPYLQQGVSKIEAMPKNNLADSIARAVAMIEHNAGYQRKG